MVFLRTKFRDSNILRKMVQEGHRWTPQELLANGMVDEIVEGGSEAVLKHALALADTRSGDARTGVYGLIKVIIGATYSSDPYLSSYLFLERVVSGNLRCCQTRLAAC